MQMSMFARDTKMRMSAPVLNPAQEQRGTHWPGGCKSCTRRTIPKSGTGTKIGSPTATLRFRMPCSCAVAGRQTVRWDMYHLFLSS